GPALIGHLGDHPRLDPRRRRVQLRRLDEWAGAPLQRIELCLHLPERALVESRADVRSVMQLSARLGAVPIADENRTQRHARAFPFRVAADDEIGALRGLHFEPRCRSPPGLVATVLALADHPFEA